MFSPISSTFPLCGLAAGGDLVRRGSATNSAPHGLALVSIIERINQRTALGDRIVGATILDFTEQSTLGPFLLKLTQP